MRKSLTAMLAAATVAGTLMASVSDADAQRRRWVGPAVAGAIIGGALLGGAIASQPYYYGPGPAYVGPGPYGCPDGQWVRRFLGYDQWGNPIYSRPRFICPY